ncbi:protein kinase [Actinomadura sp. 3N508]|uniref:serine/threonine-protein kinase n=1 Tax=Actinomadura sp. 3N508 TaxID=3375153 RepID=UPI003795ADE0
MRTPLQPGDPESIGAYRVLERLGAGGMGAVYLAEDVTGAHVAVKVIKSELIRGENGAVSARFRREIAVLRSLSRRCTAALLDADPEADPPYLVVEYVEGLSLGEAVRQDGPLRGTSLEEVAVGTAAALEHIHAEGIAHRDLKPGNVLLGPHGPRVIDFGIALLTEPGTRITATGQLWGTPPYMAPEQLMGERVTTAVDLFAWAGTVVCAASGRPPFGDDRRTVHTRILHGEPSLEGLGGPMFDMVRRALAKDPAARPSAAEVVESLRGLSRTVLRDASLGAGPAGLDADDAEGWAEKAGQSIAEGKTQLALYQAQRGLSMNPLHPRCLFHRAQANLAEGGHGLQDLQLAHEVDPDDAEIRRAYARELTARGDSRAMERAYTLEPADPVVSAAFARSLAQHGHTERAFQIAPGDPEVRHRYALMLAERPGGELDALAVSPHDPEVLSRYHRFAELTAGSAAIPPDALRAVLAVNRELDGGNTDLIRLAVALTDLAWLDPTLPAETRLHLFPKVLHALWWELAAHARSPFSLERAAALEWTARLAEFLAPGDWRLQNLARAAYAPKTSTAQGVGLAVGSGLAMLSFLLVPVTGLTWWMAVFLVFPCLLIVPVIVAVGLQAARREQRRSKARELYPWSAHD